MYSDVFCKIYDEFGWNAFPESFAPKLLAWMENMGFRPGSCLDLGCGTGILCRFLSGWGIETYGMDYSEGMIKIAKERVPEAHFDVADMTAYLPERTFDLVTCTGNALNHLPDLWDIGKVFRNVHGYLDQDGYFVFDILDENEVPTDEEIEFDYDESTHAVFHVRKDASGISDLKVLVYREGVLACEEHIREIIRDPHAVCELLSGAGFEVLRCANTLLDGEEPSMTCYVTARKR